jgi:hypothetical protein
MYIRSIAWERRSQYGDFGVQIPAPFFLSLFWYFHLDFMTDVVRIPSD